MIVGAILIAVDTGGIHWAIMSVLYEGVFKRDCSKTDASPS
jgi:hypothetical protein